MVTVSARRELVRFGQTRGLSEAPRPAHGWHEREPAAIPAAGGSQQVAAPAHRGHGASPPTARLPDDSSAVTAGRFGGQPEARTTVVPGRAADGAAAQAQEGSGGGSPAVAAAEPAE